MIHPVRLKGTPANIARYYTVGDYYTKGRDEHSEWGGQIAINLGLTGKVDPATFKALLAGQVGDQQLGRRRKNGEIEHQPGWDFAVNAPKSVSIAALVIGDERILAAHEKAVSTALDYLEEHASLRRRVKGDITHETTGRLLFARFTEHASRELDPHLHTHVVVLNMTNPSKDLPYSSLETRAMFAEQMVAGQVYRNDLAHSLREFGYSIEFDPRSGLFEVRGVPKDLIQAFSQRAEQIENHAREHGFEGQEERRKSFYATRPRKEKVTLSELHERWAARSRHHEKALAGVKEIAGKREEQALIPTPAEVGRAMLFGVRQSENSEAVNNLGRMLRVGLASDVGQVRLRDIRPLADIHEKRRKLLATRHQTGDQVHTRGRTTRGTARLEQALSMHLALGLNDASPIASSDRLLAAFEHAGLTPAQEQAVAMVATSRDRVNGIHGVAGAGKSTLVKVLREAAGHNTIAVALAPTSSAAAELGARAGIESRTIASLLARGGHNLTASHLLVVDEAGQLGNRQALRVLELSRATGARVLLLGDNKQTGAIEQGKAFWLLQRLGLPTAQLTESVRQETKSLKAAVTQARLGNYAASLAALDGVMAGDSPEALAKGVVIEWTRLGQKSREGTNILVLENATRLIVNSKIREVLKREGAIAAEDTRLSVLTSSGMTDEEKRNARFYSGGQLVTFGRDNAGLGIARDAEYRVIGIGRGESGRLIVRLQDENGRLINWDPRLGSVRRVNVFNREDRNLAKGDRIQWRLVNHELELKNAQRGTVVQLEGSLATIRWDRTERTQEIDLGRHKTWDHGYAETVYSAQSKTYDRVYVLAPLQSRLVNGQNYYTAITRARFGAKIWTQDQGKLVTKLEENSGEKTSSLEDLGRLDRDSVKAFSERHHNGLRAARLEQRRTQTEHRARVQARGLAKPTHGPLGLPEKIADRALSVAQHMERILLSVLGTDRNMPLDPQQSAHAEITSQKAPTAGTEPDRSRGPDR